MKYGGATRDRTADLLHAMQALSQLSYNPSFYLHLLDVVQIFATYPSTARRILCITPKSVNGFFKNLLYLPQIQSPWIFFVRNVRGQLRIMLGLPLVIALRR